MTNLKSKTQVAKSLDAAGISHETNGKGYVYSVEVQASDHERARAIIVGVGGYWTGYDTYVFDTSYAPAADDYCTQHGDRESELPAATLSDIAS